MISLLKISRAIALVSLVSFFILQPAVQAAPIIWGTATNTTGKSQLIEGNVIVALSGGNGAILSTGGASGNSNYSFTGVYYTQITFVPVPGGRITADVSNGATSTGDANFDTIIQSFSDTESGITTGTQTISGLTNGKEYQIQVFYNDQRDTRTGRVMTFGDGEATANTVNTTAGGSGWGQYAIGTFTASGTSQTLTHTSNGFRNVHFNAILVVDPAPPSELNTPTNLVIAPGNNQLTLHWDDNTQFGFDHYIVKRSATSGGPYTPVAGALPTASNYTDTGLTNGVNYYYVITAVNENNEESSQSAEQEGTPALVNEPPNFLFILADDMDIYTVGAYRNSEPVEKDAQGNPYLIDTPNIDRLATEGMMFHQARIMGSWIGAVCTGSRTCIMTGKNTWGAQGGVAAANTFPGVFNRGVRNASPSLPYATYRTCKIGNSYPRANDEFTVVHDATKRGNTDGSGSEWHGNWGVSYIDDWQANHRPNGKPFLIYLGFSHPHDTRMARTTPDLVGRYGCFNATNPATISLNPLAPPLPINHLPVNQADGIPANYPFHPFDNGHVNVRDEINVSGIEKYRTEEVVRNEIGRNNACADWMDQQIGRVLARLEDPNGDGDTSDSVIDNTYIVFTSDHGMALGRHGLQGKQNLYEHTWRVPYIVRGPGITAGSETDAMVYLHDTFPTFCDLAGLDLPSSIHTNDGKSFRSTLENAATPARDVLYGLYSGGSKPGIRSVTDGRFKLIKYDVEGNSTQVTQMFDLETNPFELLPEHGTPNIATQTAYAEIRQRLEGMLSEQRILNNDPYSYLGDRTVLRFEDNLNDRLPFGNDGTAMSGNGGSLPVFSSAVPHGTDYVFDETNTRSLDFEQDDQNYVSVNDHRSLDFGDAPFTIEAWVKLESLPTTNDLSSTMPVAMKKIFSDSDTKLDYMFLAAAGNYGDATNYNKLALKLGSTTIISSLSIPDTNWHHISVAFDPVSETVRFTLDSQTDTKTGITSRGIANNGPLILGAHVNSSGVVDSSFDGLIDEFSITDGVLALSELQPLSNRVLIASFKIIDSTITVENNTYNLSFESNDTQLYTIQKSNTLLEGSWVNVRTHIPGAASAQQTSVIGLAIDPNASKEFFRVIVE